MTIDLPGLPNEQRLKTINAYPKNIVASMHSDLMQKGRAAMPLRAVLAASDFALLKGHHMGQLPPAQADYTDTHWAMLRLHHCVEEQRLWLTKQTQAKE